MSRWRAWLRASGVARVSFVSLFTFVATEADVLKPRGGPLAAYRGARQSRTSGFPSRSESPGH